MIHTLFNTSLLSSLWHINKTTFQLVFEFSKLIFEYYIIKYYLIKVRIVDKTLPLWHLDDHVIPIHSHAMVA
jgi:hypothetical protein